MVLGWVPCWLSGRYKILKTKIDNSALCLGEDWLIKHRHNVLLGTGMRRTILAGLSADLAILTKAI